MSDYLNHRTTEAGSSISSPVTRAKKNEVVKKLESIEGAAGDVQRMADHEAEEYQAQMVNNAHHDDFGDIKQ